MSFETTLIHCAWVVVTELLMLAQLLLCEQLMLVCENLLVSCAEIAHHLLMHTPHMAMQVRPSQACNIAVVIRTVVSQQQDRILENLRLLITDTQILVLAEEVPFLKVLVSFLGIVGKDDMCCLSSAVRAGLRLVQCTQSKSANVAGTVIARSHTVVVDRRCANEAHLRLDIVLCTLCILSFA